jgi:ACS family hexuronate transporter-like MFS transporter
MTHAPATGLSRRAAWALALAATLTMSVSYVDRQTLAVLAPTVTKALGISEQGYGWLVSAFSLAYLVGSPLAGRVVDRVGARRGLLAAVGLWSAVAALHALVPGFGVLFALRIALGLAESPSFPGAAQTVHRALPPADRARGFGMLFTGSSIGAMVAPPLAVAIDARYGFRAAFLVTAAAGLLWLPLWLRFAWAPAAREALEGRRAPPVGTETDGASIPSVEPRLGTLELVTHPAVLRAVLVVLASAPVIAFFLNWGAKLLVRAYALEQADVGRYLWLPPLLFDAGAVAFGHLASRRAAARGVRRGEPDRPLVAAAALLCTTAALVPLASGPAGAMLVAGVAMAGGGALFALVTADMLARVPPGSVSTAGGITAAAQSLAYIVANPLVGKAVQASGSYTGTLVALGLWVVPGCVAWLAWSPPPPWSEPASAAR